jgi:hypothetical protein
MARFHVGIRPYQRRVSTVNLDARHALSALRAGAYLAKYSGMTRSVPQTKTEAAPGLETRC